MLNFKHLSKTSYLNKTLLFKVKYVVKCFLGWWLVCVSSTQPWGEADILPFLEHNRITGEQ